MNLEFSRFAHHTPQNGVTFKSSNPCTPSNRWRRSSALRGGQEVRRGRGRRRVSGRTRGCDDRDECTMPSHTWGLDAKRPQSPPATIFTAFSPLLAFQAPCERCQHTYAMNVLRCVGDRPLLIQGYLAHKKPPPLPGAPQGPRHSPTVGS